MQDLVPWRSIADGEREARTTGRPALYFFTADWCSPCHALRRSVFGDAEMAAFIQKTYVPIWVQDREQEDGVNPVAVDQLKFRFLVDTYPALVVSRPLSGPAISTLNSIPSREKTIVFLKTAVARLHAAEREVR
jgi:thiol-disulfide isomerase/thioredoxin